MNNHNEQIIPSADLADVTLTSTSVSNKASYAAPELTIHGQLELVTQQTGSDPPVGDGGGAA